MFKQPLNLHNQASGSVNPGYRNDVCWLAEPVMKVVANPMQLSAATLIS